MPEVSGNKLVNLAGLKVVHDLKLDKDFNGITTIPSAIQDTDLVAIRRPSANDGAGENYKVPMSAINPTPYVATIPTSSWSGSGDDYYITVSASNVTADSILIPHYDNASADYLAGPIWCVPASGSFTIHTSAIPSDTVTIMVQFVGVLGEAEYQVLADVYSTSQTYSKSEAVAKADIVNNLTSGDTDKPLSAAQGKALYNVTGYTGNLFSIPVIRQKTYRAKTIADTAILIVGKLASGGQIVIVGKNGGTAFSQTLIGSASVTVSTDSSGRLLFTMPNYFDGRAFETYTTAGFEEVT